MLRSILLTAVTIVLVAVLVPVGIYGIQQGGELIEQRQELSSSQATQEYSTSSAAQELFEEQSSSQQSSGTTSSRSETQSQVQSRPQGGSQIAPPVSSTPSASSSQGEERPVVPTPPAVSSVPPAVSSAPSVSVPDSQNSGNSQISYANQVVELVNQQRTQNGLPALTRNTQLKAAAQKRSQEIVSSFSHTRPNGSSFSTVLAEQEISYRSSGENIAWGQRSPEQVMQSWMNSSGHRANILSTKFTQIGVGCYRASNGVLYWTQLFIG